MTDRHGGELSAPACLHALHPHNYGPPRRWDGHARITGPCGDTMEFWIETRGDSDAIQRISFVTDGCAPSLASGSMAGTLAEDGSLTDAMTLRQADILAALDGLPRGSEHCALLAADTLRAACRDCLQARDETAAPTAGSDTDQTDKHTIIGEAGR